MAAHPYLRAYMAGSLAPTVFMLAVFAVFAVARFGYGVPFAIERAIVFPLALVPNLWGAWNVLYQLAHGRWPLGLHGAVLPLLIGPLGAALAPALGFALPHFFPAAFAVGLPAAMVLYYLAWKYLVGYLNEVLGIA